MLDIKTNKTISILHFMIIPILAVALISCEGMSCAKGIVLDSKTLQPIDSVFCEAITGTHKSYTDSLGKYEVCNNFGGCMPKCKDISVRFSKKGYKIKEVSDSENDEIIHLEKK